MTMKTLLRGNYIKPKHIQPCLRSRKKTYDNVKAFGGIPSQCNSSYGGKSTKINFQSLANATRGICGNTMIYGASERLFSGSDNITTDRKYNLDPENAKMLSFKQN